MLNSFRVKNLRSLKDTKTVNLRPITILLGENSCGKSTFLRSFPLLKQSAESTTRSSILWFGKYVDFGDFDQTLIREKGAKEITFSFGLEVPFETYKNPLRLNRIKSKNESKVTVDLRLASLGKDGLTRTAGIDFVIDGNTIKVDISDSGKINSFIVNNNDYHEFCDSYNYTSATRVLPHIRPKDDGSKDKIFRRWWNVMISPKLREALISTVKPFVHARTSTEVLDGLIHSAIIGSNQEIFQGFKNLSPSETWKKKTHAITIEDPTYTRYRDLLLLSKMALIIFNLDDILDTTFRRVTYIEPIRASVQRYYRSQDIGVSELDSKGENLAMFIRNLSDKEKTALETWTSDELGLKVASTYNGGHVSLSITFNNSKEAYNLADMGFGFSQVMPIIVQIWSILNRTQKSQGAYIATPFICVIEQPELHLHPRLQAKLAEILVRATLAAKKAEIDLFLILETHSEVIVNKIGLLTTQKVISKNDSTIALFAKDQNSNHTKVNFSEFDESGSLQNWPYGFFDFEV